MIRPHKPRCDDRALALRALMGTFGRCESGATAIEYGLIASVMGLAVITAMAAFGTGLTATYDSVSKLTTRMTLTP